MSKIINYKKGFSLIELMVAVSLFAIVMLIGTGAILSIVNGNKKNQSMQVAISNLNYAVENMTRNMKTGRNFSLPSSNSIKFITTDNIEDIYSLGGSDTDHQSLLLSENGSDPVPVTAPEINISKLKFDIFGEGASDGLQPAVLIVIEGTVQNNKATIKTDFSIHTSVTQRSVDF